METEPVVILNGTMFEDERLRKNDDDEDDEGGDGSDEEIAGEENGGRVVAVNGHHHVRTKIFRAKRQSHSLLAAPSSSSSSTVVAGHDTHVDGQLSNGVRLLKNSRKPRNGFGRGLPKKGGAGGKGTWGRPGSELFVEDEDINGDVKDPNYDSDSQDNIQLESIVPELTDEELQKIVEPIILEYFEHGDSEEVAMSLEEQNIGKKRFQIPIIAIMLAMDRKPSHRELTSVLISDLYQRILTQKVIGKSFDYLLGQLPDMILDTPEAPMILGSFIARSVADDCLPPKYVHSYKGKVESEYARAALERADVLLNMKHGLVRLDNVWGVGGGTRPVKYLIKKMVLLLKEYLSSGDSTEATRCLLDLEVPHFHHELVYEAIIIVLEDMSDRTADLICKLLKVLFSSVVVTPDQLKRGFERVFHAMPDICIDVPPAYTVLDKFVSKCQQAGYLSDEIVRKMPSRGRKRFVSEGDGGRIKEEVAGY